MTDLVEDARGLFSSISSSLFGKKQKKPKELITSIQHYLSTLNETIHSTSTSTSLPSLNSTAAPTSHSTPLSSASASASVSVVSSLTPTASASGTNATSAAQEIVTELTSDLEEIVAMLYGDNTEEVKREPDQKIAKEIIDLLFESSLFSSMLHSLRLIDFESRKYWTRIGEYALSQRRDIAVPYINEHTELLQMLVDGYEDKDVSVIFTCDALLRACIACEPLCDAILNHEPSLVTPFFKYVELPNFDVNSHAFDTFKKLLTEFPHLSCLYLIQHYDVFFAAYNTLLQSDNYLSKVQSFQFLGELLCIPANQPVMFKYVNDVDNLKLAMISLRGPQGIQKAVFTVLKIFVPNPYKSEGIIKILTANKKNFLAFLEEFEKESDDPILSQHKQEMIEALKQLE